MKALILAAGLGTRLLPYTAHTPKPLFPIGGRPLLDHAIHRLAAAGCTDIAVNTHHHHARIAAHVGANRYPANVFCRHEPQILGTGGAIANLSDFWDAAPFWVVNADVATDIDLETVWRYHQAGGTLATLVVHDHSEFNTVAVAADGRVLGFDPVPPPSGTRAGKLAFTGIHVIDPGLLKWLPSAGPACIIDTYRQLIARGERIATCRAEGHYWEDIGTPQRYRSACLRDLLRSLAGPVSPPPGTRPVPLEGDGSARSWYRLGTPPRSIILADHGIGAGSGTTEADAFVAIGRHLRSSGLPVPEIIAAEPFSGLVLVQDLGDCRLHDAAGADDRPETLRSLYRTVVALLVRMWFQGARGFDPRWTWQTARYDRRVIIEAECCYFMDAFVNGYCDMDLSPKGLGPDFKRLAARALASGLTGFMHRDFQSRNIMMWRGSPHLIDFQGGRLGPVQYDLASLLLDPYVNLPGALRRELIEICLVELAAVAAVDRSRFLTGYRYCCLTRTLQMLGAFGFLTRIAGKGWFESYIPTALASLRQQLDSETGTEFPALKSAVEQLVLHPKGGHPWPSSPS
jgi:aminoglycoside/choline kinase family phosphotransferase/dTDP-glucose pyrophosphorylase